MSGSDPQGAPEIAIQLFHLRKQDGDEHFLWHGPLLVGGTKAGRATIEMLQINLPMRVELRQWLIQAGAFPPSVQKK